MGGGGGGSGGPGGDLGSPLWGSQGVCGVTMRFGVRYLGGAWGSHGGEEGEVGVRF